MFSLRILPFLLRFGLLYSLMTIPVILAALRLLPEVLPWRISGGWVLVPCAVLAFVLALLWQAWQEKRFLTRSRDVQRAFSHLVCLAELPPMHRPKPGPLLHSTNDDAATVELFQTLYASVQLAFTFSNQQYLLVTSADRGEGKSLVAANLAAASARMGRRVLLVEGHWDAPTQHLYFGLSRRGNLAPLLQRVAGMVDLRSEMRALITLVNERPQLTEWLTRSLQATAQPNLFILTNGTEPIPAPLRHPVLIRGILEAALTQFDLVICDGPPMLTRDGGWRTLAVMGEVLLVAAAYHTRHRELYQTIETLRRHPISPIGIVLNHRQVDRTYPQPVVLLPPPTVPPVLPSPALKPAAVEPPPTPDAREDSRPRNGHKSPTSAAAPGYASNGNGYGYRRAAAPVNELVTASAALLSQRDEGDAAALSDHIQRLEGHLREKESLLNQKEQEMEQFFRAQGVQNELFAQLRQELATQQQETQRLQTLLQQQNDDFFRLEQTARQRIQELEQKLTTLQSRLQTASATLYRRWREG